MRLHLPTVIARKRDGEELHADEIRALVSGFTTGEIPDYQMAAFEVVEALQTFAGNGPDDLIELVLTLATRLTPAPREELLAHLHSGRAKQKFEAIVSNQGGKPSDLERLLQIHRAPIIRPVPAADTGTVARVRADLIGQAALELGAGRSRRSDAVDHAVGLDQLVTVGQHVHQGQPRCRIHARSAVDFEIAEAMVAQAIRLDP